MKIKKFSWMKQMIKYRHSLSKYNPNIFAKSDQEISNELAPNKNTKKKDKNIGE